MASVVSLRKLTPSSTRVHLSRAKPRTAPDVGGGHTVEICVQPRMQHVMPEKERPHQISMFSTKAIADVSTTKEELSELTFLNTIDTAENSTWNKTILVDGKQFCFKLDTWVEATVMSEEVWKLLGAVELKKPTKRLCGPDQKPLEVLGELHVNMSHKETTVGQLVFIIKQLKNNLLGLPAIKALNLLAMVESVED